MDLIDDDPFDGLEVLDEALPREQHLQGLGCRDKDLRRILRLRVPLRLRGVSVPDSDGYPQGLAVVLHPAEHVAVEGPQRGDVDAPESGPFAFGGMYGVEDRQHSRLGLPDARRSDKEYVPSFEDPRYDIRLGRCRFCYPPLRQRLYEFGAQLGERHEMKRRVPGTDPGLIVLTRPWGPLPWAR